MTSRAFPGGGFENRDRLAFYEPDVLMTGGALHPAMLAWQREARPPVVIELRWTPVHGGMAIRAQSAAVLPRELPHMRFPVTLVAVSRRGAEIDIGQPHLRSSRLVALGAFGVAVRADEPKGIHRMREAHYFPGFCRVTGFTASQAAVATHLR